MNSLLFIAAACTGILSGQAAVPADELRQNYQSIIERNPFGLKPIPEPQKPPPAPEKKPEIDYFLTGITAVGHPVIPRQAYIMTREQGQKEPSYYALPEWSPQNDMQIDGIKVLNIDPKSGEVKVETPHGSMLLSFKTHGVQPPATPVAGVPGAAGRPGQAGAVPPPPGSPPTAYARPLPGRPGATITTPGGSYNRGGTIPPRTVRTRGSSNRGSVGTPGISSPPQLTPGQPQQDAPEPVDPALQYINLRLQEEAARQEGVAFPPVPPIE